MIKHFLITAGGTREYIDPVRFISNASSGKMGFALAQAALKAGHKVTLITTLKLKTQNSKLKTLYVETAEQMYDAVKGNFKNCDCLIMAAAVSDYTPAKKSETKIKKSDKNLLLKLKPTVDILKWAGKNKKKNQMLVGFALEDKNLYKNAEKKLKDKNLDMIIANKTSAIGSEHSRLCIKTTDSKWQRLADAPKNQTARRLVKMIEQSIRTVG